MNTTVTETTRLLTPLSVAIANGIMRSINFILDYIETPKKSASKKVIEQFAYSLQLEYPRESKEYVMNMAIQMYKDGGRNV